MILSLFLVGLQAVSAQGAFGNLGATMQKMFGPVLLLQFGMGNFVFWAKFLIWVLVFALLYAVSFKVAVLSQRKNIQVVVTMILALITVIPLSGELLWSLFQTYAIMVAFVLFFVPIGGILYLSHKLFSDQKRLQYAMKAILFYLLAVIIANVTQTFTATFDVGSFQNMSSLALGICFLMFIWNLFRALMGGADEFPRQNITNSGGMPSWLRDAASGGSTPTQTPTTPATPLPPNLGQALRVIQDNITQYTNGFEPLTQRMNGLLTLRRQQVFPPPNGPAVNMTHLNNMLTGVRDMRADLDTRGAGINNMLRQIRANNPDMGLADERRLADLAGLWQARLFIVNNYLMRSRVSYARGGGPIGRP